MFLIIKENSLIIGGEYTLIRDRYLLDQQDDRDQNSNDPNNDTKSGKQKFVQETSIPF